MTQYQTYKGKPIVRKGNIIYFGKPDKKYIARIEIMSTKKIGELDLPDKVDVKILLSDRTFSMKKRTIKTSAQNGLYGAIDMANVWLDYYNDKELSRQ